LSKRRLRKGITTGHAESRKDSIELAKSYGESGYITKVKGLKGKQVRISKKDA